MVTRPMPALAGFPQDLRFPPAFKIVVVRDQNPSPPRGTWGAVGWILVLKGVALISCTLDDAN